MATTSNLNVLAPSHASSILFIRSWQSPVKCTHALNLNTLHSVFLLCTDVELSAGAVDGHCRWRSEVSTKAFFSSRGKDDVRLFTQTLLRLSLHRDHQSLPYLYDPRWLAKYRILIVSEKERMHCNLAQSFPTIISNISYLTHWFALQMLNLSHWASLGPDVIFHTQSAQLGRRT